MQSANRAPMILGRALKLRCPRCGKGKFLEHGFTTYVRCPECNFLFRREDGYWLGAIFVNLISVQFIIIGGFFLLDATTDLSMWPIIGILATIGLVYPIIFYPLSKSIWLAMDHFFTDPDPDKTDTPVKRSP